MTTIISNDNFKIIKNNNKFIIYFASYSESLIKSLTKTGVILGTTVTSDYKTLMFKSIGIKSSVGFIILFIIVLFIVYPLSIIKYIGFIATDLGELRIFILFKLFKLLKLYKL